MMYFNPMMYLIYPDHSTNTFHFGMYNGTEIFMDTFDFSHMRSNSLSKIGSESFFCILWHSECYD